MEKNLTTYILIGVVAAVLLAGGGYLLLKGQPAPADTEHRSSVSKPSTAPPASPSSKGSEGQLPTEVTEITVSGSEFSFNPAVITAREGERIKIVFKNVGRAPHNLMIKELNVGTQTIAAGQTDSFEFTAPRAGEYSFFCSVPGHREAGMVGRLSVE